MIVVAKTKKRYGETWSDCYVLEPPPTQRKLAVMFGLRLLNLIDQGVSRCRIGQDDGTNYRCQCRNLKYFLGDDNQDAKRKLPGPETDIALTRSKQRP